MKRDELDKSKDNGAPSLQSMLEVKLETLLHDLIRQHGTVETAKALGVNYKTLTAAPASSHLTPRLYDALERLLMIRKFAALEEVIESVRGLAKQVVEWVEELERVAADRTWPLRPQPRQEFRRTDPSVVTMAPQAGESEVYGPALPR